MNWDQMKTILKGVKPGFHIYTEVFLEIQLLMGLSHRSCRTTSILGNGMTRHQSLPDPGRGVSLRLIYREFITCQHASCVPRALSNPRGRELLDTATYRLYCRRVRERLACIFKQASRQADRRMNVVTATFLLRVRADFFCFFVCDHEVSPYFLPQHEWLTEAGKNLESHVIQVSLYDLISQPLRHHSSLGMYRNDINTQTCKGCYLKEARR